MRFPSLLSGALALLAVAGCAAPSVDPDTLCAGRALTERVRTANHCLVLRTFESAERVEGGTLVVVLHGDGTRMPTDHQYRAAERIAQRNADVVAVGLLRPGYEDGAGNRSSGARGRANGDNYTAEVADSVAEALRLLAAHHATDRTLVVGHSGGGAIAALAVSRHHGLVDRALLIGCPCDVKRWREHMYALQSSRVWRRPVESLSPIELAPEFDPATTAIVVVGSEDAIAPPELSEAYAAALIANGKVAELTVLAGAGHAILAEPAVEEIVDRALRELRSGAGDG